MHITTVSRILALGAFLLVGSTFAVSAAEAAPCTEDALRRANSSNRIYITGPVTCTLTDIVTLDDKAQIELVDAENAIWHVRMNLIVQEGARLELHGTDVGGDANEVRLHSVNNSSDHPFIFLRGDWGTIDIDSTKVTSWDGVRNGPDKKYSNGRAFIQVRSRLNEAEDGGNESWLNIRNSEIAYLGYKAAESYGLSWKVAGIDPARFDVLDVRGEVLNSIIHHNYFGIYTYGAFGMTIDNNRVHSNVVYGIDPHDDSDNMTITNNAVYENGYHGIICSQRCDTIVINHNNSSHNGGNGIMIHRNVTDSEVAHNVTDNNRDSGIAIFDSHRNTVHHNIARGNQKGIRFSVGASHNEVYENDLIGSTKYGIYSFKGKDIPLDGGAGKPHHNIIRDNLVHSTKGYAARLIDFDNNVVRNNTFDQNQREVQLLAAVGNTFDGNHLTNGKGHAVTINWGTTGERSNGNQVLNNTIENHKGGGLRIFNSHDTVVHGNTIQDNKYGVWTVSAERNDINANTIQNNKRYGIYLSARSRDARVTNNTIDDNKTYGVQVRQGSDRPVITGNEINNHTYGIFIAKQVADPTIADNTFSGNRYNVRPAKYE